MDIFQSTEGLVDKTLEVAVGQRLARTDLEDRLDGSKMRINGDLTIA